MTQEQWDIVKRIDEKCGFRIIYFEPDRFECSEGEFDSLTPNDEDAIAWRLMLEIIHLSGEATIRRSKWKEGERFSVSSFASTADGYEQCFDALLLVAGRVLL